MIDLDFVFLAEYAKAESGGITAVGAGVTAMTVAESSVDRAREAYIAGRYLISDGGSNGLTFEIVRPGEAGTLLLEVDMAPQDLPATSGEGFFAFRVDVEVKVEGRWSFRISNEIGELRHMSLDVVHDRGTSLPAEG